VPVVQATVIAGSGLWAEVFTKSIMVCGTAALQQLDGLGLAARAVLADGDVRCSDRWAEYVREPCTRN
jgi:thiamine biosynthesis lipoprotein ApbE